VFTDEEYVRMIKAARQKQIGAPFRWDILAIRNDLIDRARIASSKAMSQISVANLLQQPSSSPNKKCCQTQLLDSKEVKE
jgi:hypothetical protein